MAPAWGTVAGLSLLGPTRWSLTSMPRTFNADPESGPSARPPDPATRVFSTLTAKSGEVQ